MKRHEGRVEVDASVSCGGDNSSPVGVCTGDRGFDEGAIGDVFGDLKGCVAVGEAFDVDGDEVRGTFGIADDACGEVSADFRDGGGDNAKVSRR